MAASTAMKAYFGVASALALLATIPALAGSYGGVEITVQDTMIQANGVVVAVVQIRNQKLDEIDYVSVICEFRNSVGDAVGVGSGEARNLPSGAEVRLEIKARYVPSMNHSECYAEVVAP